MTPEPTEPTRASQPQEDLQLAPPPAPAPEPPVQPAPATTTTTARPSPSFARTMAAAIVAAIILATGGGIGVGWTLARYISEHNTATQTAQVQTAPKVQQGTSGANLDLNAISRKVSPAVVDINTTIQTASGTAAAAGTGLIITSSGDVLTNNHVVEGSVSIRVTIQGKSGRSTATVVGVDPADDLAVIHINGVSGLPTVTMGDSSSMKVGDTVFALGNALGLGGAPRVTQGSVTALDQSITASDNGSQAEQLTGMIQTDAEISPGDSGGALVNSAGQVIGIITAGEAQGFRSNSTTIAYAIPSSKATDIANKILAGQAGDGIYIGPVGYLGVSVQDVDAATASQLGLSVDSGALVRSVVAGSPAQKAGITAGSVITGVNSTVVDSSDSLGNALHQFKPGDQVTITWVIGTTKHTASATLTSGPAI